LYFSNKQKTVDQKSQIGYNVYILAKQEQKMTTATYSALTEQEKREVRMFGVTEAGMREAVESSSTFKFSGPAMAAASMLSDAQEMVSYGPYDGDTLANILEDQRQLLNRAKFVLFEYFPDRR
jgi:hypothetical protein